ncbi:MAG TPA: hypothetical protein VIC58_10740 [Actinomycetota bacterium]|jgi:polyhydroxyalkanoate synthesis regulator phasin
MVVKEVRKAVGAATDKISSTGAQELARSLMQGQGKEQVSKAAQEIMKWSAKNRERVMELVRTEVQSQMKTMGVATREEVDALRKRVRELERARPKPRTAKRSTAKRSTTTTASTTRSSGDQA